MAIVVVAISPCPQSGIESAAVAEDDARIGAIRHGLAEHREHDPVVPARLQGQRGTEPAVPAREPLPLVINRATSRHGKPTRDEPHDAAGGMGIDGGETDRSGAGHDVSRIISRVGWLRSCLRAPCRVAHADSLTVERR